MCCVVPTGRSLVPVTPAASAGVVLVGVRAFERFDTQMSTCHVACGSETDFHGEADATRYYSRFFVYPPTKCTQFPP